MDATVLLRLSWPVRGGAQISWNNNDTVVTGSTPVQLSGGLPAGGTYNGNGVSDNIFYPDSAGPGAHIITYSYTDSGGCSASVTKTFVVVTGIQQSGAESTLLLYPNPVRDMLFVRSGISVPAGVRALVYDIAGNMVPVSYTVKNSDYYFNTALLESGMYVIKFSGTAGIICTRFTKL